jgi:hypothetical protein
MNWQDAMILSITTGNSHIIDNQLLIDGARHQDNPECSFYELMNNSKNKNKTQKKKKLEKKETQKKKKLIKIKKKRRN